MRKQLPIVAVALLAVAAGAWHFTRPGEVRAQQAPQGPELVRYGDVIVDITRVVAVTHTPGEAISFTLDLGRPDGTTAEVVLSKNMSADEGYVEKEWAEVVKDLRVGR